MIPVSTLIGSAIVASITVLIVLYTIWIRPWMRRRQAGWAKRFLDWIEPIERRLWKKSEQILWARWLQFVGIVVPLLHFLGALDVTPILAVVPPQYAPYLLFSVWVLGQISAWLRKDITKPVDLVDVPENAPIEVKVAIAQAASANDNAVAVVKAAQASGDLQKAA